MGFIQVFTLEDKEKLIKNGLHYITEQEIGSGKVYIFVNDIVETLLNPPSNPPTLKIGVPNLEGKA